MEKKFTMEQVKASCHQGYSIYGTKKGYCDLVKCCDHCDKKVRFWCKAICKIEKLQTKIIKNICK